jgi:hypothetical protein
MIMASEKQELEILASGKEPQAPATTCCTGGTGMAKIK